MCVGYGMPRADALNAVTTTPAEVLGLGNRVGTLEAGKDGNIVLFSGDPLSVRSHVEYVVIEGDLAYDRSKDSRDQHLNDGTRPANTAPSDDAGEESDDESEDDEEEEEDDDKKKDKDTDKDEEDK